MRYHLITQSPDTGLCAGRQYKQKSCWQWLTVVGVQGKTYNSVWNVNNPQGYLIFSCVFQTYTHCSKKVTELSNARSHTSPYKQAEPFCLIFRFQTSIRLQPFVPVQDGRSGLKHWKHSPGRQIKSALPQPGFQINSAPASLGRMRVPPSPAVGSLACCSSVLQDTAVQFPTLIFW